MSETRPKDEVATADERTTLLAFLGHQRDFLVRKATGITEKQARLATCPPSDLTMLGLVRHLADVERGWAQRAFAGRESLPLYYGEAHPNGDPDGDFHPLDGDTLTDALEVLHEVAADADLVYQAGDLDEVEHHERGQYSLRWILIHLIEEYARHLGHADLIRQAIDGQTGE